MTFLHVTDALEETNEKNHFLEMINYCINPKPQDPEEREEAVYPFLDELGEHLEQKIIGKTSRNELKRTINKWIDQKIAQVAAEPEGD
ncbi:MAG: hypothetical protein WC489_07895 [Patescibacteria group bacterium]|jgi:hypothetical protein|nr:hypothetical protein [Methanoregulaceae archaeon]